ncbi:MAG TPA: gas vesicle protein G [Amycolatopsis sp.]|nr:gas vesicle protein G [Amycolatopsis sp.]
MGLLSGIVGLPLAPLRGVLALAEVIRRRVDEEAHSMPAARRELEAAQEARAAGEISAEEEAEIQRRVLNRMTRARPSGRSGERER